MEINHSVMVVIILWIIVCFVVLFFAGRGYEIRRAKKILKKQDEAEALEKGQRKTKTKIYERTNEITLVNNRTDKETIIKSINEFGLEVTYNENEPIVFLKIEQYLTDYTKDHPFIIGLFYDHSIKSFIDEKIEIPR